MAFIRHDERREKSWHDINDSIIRDIGVVALLYGVRRLDTTHHVTTRYLFSAIDGLNNHYCCSYLTERLHAPGREMSYPRVPEALLGGGEVVVSDYAL